MPWSGGVYTRTNGTYNGSTVWASDAAAAVKIQSSRHDTHDQDLATGINACLRKDSTNAPTTGVMSFNAFSFAYTSNGVTLPGADGGLFYGIGTSGVWQQNWTGNPDGSGLGTAIIVADVIKLSAQIPTNPNATFIVNGVYCSATGMSFRTATAGTGIFIKEGANAKQGTATLVAGSVVVSNTSVTATSRIFLTSQSDGGAPGFLRVSARTAGTSFTITSSSGTDTSTVAYEIFEPG